MIPERSRREFERGQLDDLRALGIDWDGPVVRQSERGALYERALAALEAQGRLYACFCTRAEVRAAASAPHGDLPEGAYPGTCRALSAAERQARIDSGRRYALRLRADGERVEFVDGLLGQCDAVVDDFVVRRADGVTAYQLAVVVDDADQSITEVVRGADLVSSTPRQIVLGRCGLPAPAYAHVPLVLSPDGSRLAKRDGAAMLAHRDQPAARTLALLAHTLDLAAGRTRSPRRPTCSASSTRRASHVTRWSSFPEHAPYACGCRLSHCAHVVVPSRASEEVFPR